MIWCFMMALVGIAPETVTPRSFLPPYGTFFRGSHELPSKNQGKLHRNPVDTRNVGSVPIVGVTTVFARRGLQPARANAASPGTGCILHHARHAALPSLSSMAAAM